MSNKKHTVVISHLVLALCTSPLLVRNIPYTISIRLPAQVGNVNPPINHWQILYTSENRISPTGRNVTVSDSSGYRFERPGV